MEVEDLKENNLKGLRISKGLVQREIAYKSGISIPFYSMVESGIRVPSLKCSRRISSILGISLDDFYSLIEKNINKV